MSWTISNADLLLDYAERYRGHTPVPAPVGRTWLEKEPTIWHGLDSFEPPLLRPESGPRPATPTADLPTIPATQACLLSAANAADPRAIADAERLKRLAGGALAAYSVEEIRQLVNEPKWTREYIDEVVAPLAGNLGRPVDRKGDAPHTFFATRLAHFMNGCPEGTDEAKMLEAFFDQEKVPTFWPSFTPVDLCRLRVLYPFVPTWADGVKSAEAYADHTILHDSDIEVLAGVPIYDRSLEWIAAERGEHGRMKNVALIEAAGTFANIVPRLNTLVEIDGMRGKDIHIVAKHYSSSHLIVDAIRAEFGAEVEVVVEGALEKSKAMVQNLLEEIESNSQPGTPTKIMAHVEGVRGFWPWYTAQAAQHHDVPMLGLSHTTSDGRDLMANVADPNSNYLELMSLSPAKIADERLRFERSFEGLVDAVGKALPNMEIYDRPWVVVGYGEIIGPAMANALKSLKVPYTIVDKDPERLKAAVAEGHSTSDGLDDYYRMDPFIVECAGTQVLGADELKRFIGNPVLMSLGSGRYGFDMDTVGEMANASGYPLPKREVGRLGWLPIVDYHTEQAKFTAIADGYVANLAFPEPHHSAYAMTTQLLAWEGMRQALYNYEHNRPGAHILRALDIETVENKAGGVSRNIHLYPRDIESENGPNLELVAPRGTITTPAASFRVFHHRPEADPNQSRPVGRQVSFGGWDSVEDRQSAQRKK